MKVISGGQTGVDRAALDAALACGLEIGGYCPAGRRAEDGRIPDRYPLVEMVGTDYQVRTRRNIEAADATLVLVTDDRQAQTSGTRFTLTCLERGSRRRYLALLGTPQAIPKAMGLIEGVAVLNVAGPRESKAPGIYRAAYDFLLELFCVAGRIPT